MDSTALVTYSISEAVIAQLRAACASLTCDTPAEYEETRVAIGNLRTARTSIEKERVKQKAEALEFGRFVDSEAKRFTDLLFEIENPLKAKKAVIDDEADRVKREKEAAALKAVQDEINRNNAAKAAEEKAIRDAEESRLAVERESLRVERERLAAEQAKIDAERAKVDADRRAVEVERQKAERAEFERQAKIKAAKDAAEQLTRDVLEKARRDAELAALAPDLVKVEAFVAAIRTLQAPKLKSRKLTDMVAAAAASLARAADTLASYSATAKGLHNG